MDSWAFLGIGDCILPQSIKSYDMSHYITSDVLNNGAFVKESTEGLFHQEPVYLPTFSAEDMVCYLHIHDS